MPVFAVQYTYDDRAELRAQVRPAHRAFLRGLLDEGALLASGPFAGPTTTAGDGSVAEAEPDGALLLVRAASTGAALERLALDPFAEHGLLAGVSARAWDPVLGPWAD